MFTKSGIMVGAGRGAERGSATDGRSPFGGTSISSIGQYPAADQEAPPGDPASCRPTNSRPMRRSPQTKGFLLVSASPLTRSSHHAGGGFRGSQGGAGWPGMPVSFPRAARAASDRPDVRPGQRSRQLTALHSQLQGHAGEARRDRDRRRALCQNDAPVRPVTQAYTSRVEANRTDPHDRRQGGGRAVRLPRQQWTFEPEGEGTRIRFDNRFQDFEPTGRRRRRTGLRRQAGRDHGLRSSTKRTGGSGG